MGEAANVDGEVAGAASPKIGFEDRSFLFVVYPTLLSWFVKIN